MACVEKDCQKPVFNKGKSLCGMHYYRLLRNGATDRLVKQEQKQDWVDRFWSKVDKTGNCWEWISTIDNYGYGVFQRSYPERKSVKAHRVSYELSIGAIPDGLTLDHLCYNTKCVRPSHLEPVTLSENSIRAAKRRAMLMDMSRYMQKIEAAKTSLPEGHQDADWMDGFNAGLDWALRILSGDKSAS